MDGLRWFVVESVVVVEMLCEGCTILVCNPPVSLIAFPIFPNIALADSPSLSFESKS